MTEQVEVPPLAGATLAVRQLVNAAHQFLARTSRELDVNLTDMSALSLLGQYGSMGPTALAGCLGIRTASVSALIDRLERAGHVERVRSADDRRRVNVRTTPSAHDASLGLVLPTIMRIDRLSRDLDDQDRCVVTTFLEAVAAVMREPEGSGLEEETLQASCRPPG